MSFLLIPKGRKTLAAVIVVLACGFLATPTYSASHNYITTYRSSVGSHMFVAQSLDGEYGQYTLRGKLVSADNGTDDMVVGTETSQWRGIGLRTEFGLELMKFVQFTAGHTFVNMRNQENGLEQLEGSRLHGETRLVFLSPIGNLEAGLGASVLRLSYQRILENSDFVGTGIYYTVGTSYFLSSRVSLFAKAKSYRDHLMRNGGSAVVKSIDTATTAVSLGFRIWM